MDSQTPNRAVGQDALSVLPPCPADLPIQVTCSGGLNYSPSSITTTSNPDSNETDFYVPLNLVVSRSTYLLRKWGTREDLGGHRIKCPEIEAWKFQQYIYWLTGPADPFQNLLEGTPLSFLMLSSLWYLGHCIQSPSFQNAIVDTLYSRFFPDTTIAPYKHTPLEFYLFVKDIYSHRPATGEWCQLTQLAICAYHGLDEQNTNGVDILLREGAERGGVEAWECKFCADLLDVYDHDQSMVLQHEKEMFLV